MAATKTHFIANIPAGVQSQKHHNQTPFYASELRTKQNDLCIILYFNMAFIGIPTFMGLIFANPDLFTEN